MGVPDRGPQPLSMKRPLLLKICRGRINVQHITWGYMKLILVSNQLLIFINSNANCGVKVV
jgi:hypothetical protein